MARQQRYWDAMWPSLLMVGALITSPYSAMAQRIPIADDTLGNERSQISPDAVINNQLSNRIHGGARRGATLFHSFRDFNIDEGRAVYFANPNGVRTILGRVTGTRRSEIFGTLGVLGNANLFLLNPNGILFGPTAQLDIRGSFVASTGDRFVLSDGSEFSATNPRTAPLLTVNITPGLQYGTRQRGDLSNAANLAVAVGQNLTLYGGTVTVTGSLTAPGGTVHVLGDRIALLENAQIDVSGKTGGGTVLIGGDYRGQGSVPNALRTFVGPGVMINADALSHGNGGRAIVWGDEVTGFYGNIRARGGSRSGNGGFVEVSGRQSLQFEGQVDVGATYGEFGTLLLDPRNIVISNTASTDGVDASLPDIFQGDFSDTDITIRATNLQNQTGNIILEASNDIILNNGVSLDFLNSGNSGSITFHADADGDRAGSFIMSPTDGIRTNGRDIILRGANLTLGNIYTNTEVFGGGSGNITIRSTGSVTAEAALDDEGFRRTIFWQTRPYTLEDDVKAGDITIDIAGQLELQDVEIDASSEARSGSISIHARSVELLSFHLDTGNQNDSVSPVNSNAGHITITTDRFVASNNSGGSTTSFAGRGGDIIINSPHVELLNEAAFSSVVEGGQASSGSIQINAGRRGTVILGNNAGVLGSPPSLSTRNIVGSGTSGDIRITTGTLQMSNAEIETSTNGSGRGGDIIINATSTIDLRNSVLNSSSGDVGVNNEINNRSTGAGGDITISTTSLTLSSGSRVQAETNGPGAAGNIFITANLIDISGANVSGFNSGLLVSSERNPVDSDGNPVFDFPRDERGNVIPGTEETVPVLTGDGGTITINHENHPRGTLRLSEGGFLSALTRSDSTGGDININVNRLDVQSGGQIITNATPESNGSAGNITINAARGVRIAGIDFTPNPPIPPDLPDPEEPFLLTTNPDGDTNPNILEGGISRSGLFAQTEGGGGAGSITITTNELTVEAGSSITVSGEERGAGNLRVNADSVVLNNGRLEAIASAGNGGNITLNVSGSLFRLSSRSQISARAQNDANGGNVMLEIPNGFIVANPFDNSDILANAEEGDGGNIAITTRSIFGLAERNPLSPFSDINASSEFGSAGAVTINTPDVDPDRGLAQLPVDLTDASQFIAQTCPSGNATATQSNEFVVTGRGGLPPTPFEALRQDTVQVDLVTANLENESPVSPNSRPEPTPNRPSLSSGSPIVEAQGWQVAVDGGVMLVAADPQTVIASSLNRLTHCR